MGLRGEGRERDIYREEVGRWIHNDGMNLSDE